MIWIIVTSPTSNTYLASPGGADFTTCYSMKQAKRIAGEDAVVQTYVRVPTPEVD